MLNNNSTKQEFAHLHCKQCLPQHYNRIHGFRCPVFSSLSLNFEAETEQINGGYCTKTRHWISPSLQCKRYFGTERLID